MIASTPARRRQREDLVRSIFDKTASSDWARRASVAIDNLCLKYVKVTAGETFEFLPVELPSRPRRGGATY